MDAVLDVVLDVVFELALDVGLVVEFVFDAAPAFGFMAMPLTPCTRLLK